MRSMTGFGRGTNIGDDFSITIEIKTVNNRFLDVNFRMPAELQSVEQSLKRRIGEKLSRGRADVNIQYDRSYDSVYELNRDLISGYLLALKELQTEFSIAGEPDINTIARLPGVLNLKKQDPEPDFLTAIEQALDAAIADLQAMREKEGAALSSELAQRLSAIEKRIPVIEGEAELVAKEYVEKLKKRIEDLLAKSESQVEIDSSRLAQEAAYLADRADISEEIQRLRTHIDHFRSIMEEESEVGKRLDFLTQELNREANTIASKTNNMTVKENALAIKSEIEKIREQVQNVE
jgi:uncharacterized protein (TIGR00255 family)